MTTSRKTNRDHAKKKQFYAVLVDLGDAVADELSLPFDDISLGMIYRGLYHFTMAHQKGKATEES